MGEEGINNNEIGPKRDSVTLKSHGRVTSHIFVKEPEESFLKILSTIIVRAGRVYIFKKDNL